MKTFNKITVGFVTQSYEVGDDGVARCVSQQFFAGDDCSYENEDGDIIANPNEVYCPFEMKQPEVD